jgi:hypothetical protein
MITHSSFAAYASPMQTHTHTHTQQLLLQLKLVCEHESTPHENDKKGQLDLSLLEDQASKSSDYEPHEEG